MTNPVGAPRKQIDPEKVEELAGQGLAQYQIAKGCGVSWNTYQTLRDSNSEISEALKRGQAAAIGNVESALYASAVGGNLGAMCFFLKNRDSENWKERTYQELTGKDGKDLLPTAIEIIGISAK